MSGFPGVIALRHGGGLPVGAGGDKLASARPDPVSGAARIRAHSGLAAPGTAGTTTEGKDSSMLKKFGIVTVLAAGLGIQAGCTGSQSANTATGALIGAAAGQAVGEGRGRTAATLAGAAVGAQVGASQPTTCTYRNAQTGQTYRAACP